MTDTDILLLALDADIASVRTREHVRKCARCTVRVASVRRAVAELAGQAHDTPQSAGPIIACLDETALARLASGEPRSATPAEIAHLLHCAHCRGELASLVELLGDSSIAHEIRAAEIQPDARFTRRHLPTFAAAAVLLLLAWPTGRRWLAPSAPSSVRESVAHRGPTIAASGAPTLLTPKSDVDGLPTFSWTAVSGARRYRLTLYDHSGHVVYESEVTDTTLALPDSIVLARAVVYGWQVEARTGIDRWTPSELAIFTLAAPGRKR